MAAVRGKLKGLFDRPISSPIDATNPIVQSAVSALSANSDSYEGDQADQCPPGYLPNAYGGCDIDPYNVTSGTGANTGSTFVDTGSTNTTTTVIEQQPAANVNVTVPVSITDTGIQQISDQLTKAIQTTNQQTQNTIQAINDSIQKGIENTDAETQKVVDSLNKSIVSNIQEESDSIQNSINNASTNLGDEVKITSAAIAASTVATTTTVAKSINDEIDSVKNAITPILSSITGFIDQINVEVQKINDTFLQPIINLYNSTIGTVAMLTTAIETDLHEGISGLLKIPGQLADQLGSFDATLDRTVQQLGTVNKETVTDGITFLSQSFPDPLSKSMNAALGGATTADAIKTTFTNHVDLTAESFQQVSTEAISGIGSLLTQMLHILMTTFKTPFDQLHADWSSVGGIFVGLLDGALGLLTTVTSMAALAAPLIDAAEQEARILVPTAKLAPATVIEAMKRGFLDAKTGMKEIAASGLDSTRQQVLVDLGVFLADVNTAIGWWYRGIIDDGDLAVNMTAHGITPLDQQAIKASTVNLPALSDLLRWMNFGIITQDQFISNAHILRYDDSQITAILSTYQDRETPQTLSQLSGLLNNSSAGFLSATLSQPVPDTIQISGARAGYHPDLIRYIWLNHWTIPSVDVFIQSYFRGLRTLTELQERMAMANIPSELWDELLQIARPLLPLRTIPSLYSKGLITEGQAQTELAQHGHNQFHIDLILKAYAPVAKPVDTTQVAAIHTLSQSNARTLWSEGAITDDQYTQVLEAHGYTSATAALQLKADAISEHIKAQKQELADLTDQVLSGVMTGDDAVTKLNTDGFTLSQISKFGANIAKQQKVNAKIPTIPDLNRFLKAQLITLDQYTTALQQLGWQDPWLSAYLGLVSSNGVPAGTDTGATA
jgi:hypothetical protein